MKALKAFIKPFEAPQRNVKIKMWVNFLCSSRTLWKDYVSLSTLPSKSLESSLTKGSRFSNPDKKTHYDFMSNLFFKFSKELPETVARISSA